MMRALGRNGTAAIGLPSLFGLLTTAPVFNHHTDYTALFEPATGTYNSTVWMGE